MRATDRRAGENEGRAPWDARAVETGADRRDIGCVYDVIVVGLGHAGVEAALACARMGLRTAGVT
ncbi:MAG TPA: FAD-dependent oxidoreductase, partial [Myxococcaceae bacterium]|nr:FAD-dependent oxidoreductase [Myxococcaceae bacterium]